jgi:hypothetical protein
MIDSSNVLFINNPDPKPDPKLKSKSDPDQKEKKNYFISTTLVPTK